MPDQRQLRRFEPRYREFAIPKRSGGTRRIPAPDDELKRLQRSILLRLLPVPYHLLQFEQPLQRPRQKRLIPLGLQDRIVDRRCFVRGHFRRCGF